VVRRANGTTIPCRTLLESYPSGGAALALSLSLSLAPPPPRPPPPWANIESSPVWDISGIINEVLSQSQLLL